MKLRLRKRAVLADLSRLRVGETVARPVASGVHVLPSYKSDDREVHHKRPSFDDVVDARMKDFKFIEVAE